MTETYTLDGEPLSVCSTSALQRELRACADIPDGLPAAGVRHVLARTAAIRAELATRRDGTGLRGAVATSCRSLTQERYEAAWRVKDGLRR